MLNWIKENENLALFIFAGFTIFIMILFCIVLYKGINKSLNEQKETFNKFYETK